MELTHVSQLAAKFEQAAERVSGKAQRADSDADVRAGRVRLHQRRNDRVKLPAGWNCSTVQVEETLAYYSMLHRKPMGKHHVQVCTNVACMLRGGNEILAHAKKRLEIGHKETTHDGIFRWKKWNASAPARARRPCR